MKHDKNFSLNDHLTSEITHQAIFQLVGPTVDASM